MKVIYDYASSAKAKWFINKEITILRKKTLVKKRKRKFENVAVDFCLEN